MTRSFTDRNNRIGNFVSGVLRVKKFEDHAGPEATRKTGQQIYPDIRPGGQAHNGNADGNSGIERRAGDAAH